MYLLAWRDMTAKEASLRMREKLEQARDDFFRLSFTLIYSDFEIKCSNLRC